MLRDRLKLLAFMLLDALMRSLAAGWELAWRNRRMTAKGIVGVLVLLGAHYGFEVSEETQLLLATLIAAYLGLVGRDRYRRIR